MFRISVSVISLLAAATAFAGDARLVYERPGVTASGFVGDIQPIRDADRNLLGFVVASESASAFDCLQIKHNSTNTFSCPRPIFARCSYAGQADTSFYVFALGMSDWKFAVYRWAFDSDFSLLGTDSIGFGIPYPGSQYYWVYTAAMSVRDAKTTGKPVVVVSFMLDYVNQLDPSRYMSEDCDGKTLVFDLGLKEKLYESFRTMLVPMSALGSSWFGFVNYYHWLFEKDYTQPGDPIIETWDYGSHATLQDSLYQTFWIKSQDEYWYWTAFAGDFDGSRSGDEVIVQYNKHTYPSAIFDVNVARRESLQTACLAPEADSFRTVWHRGSERLLLGHVFEAQRYVAGVKYDSIIAAIRYSTGVQVDSVVLDRSLASYTLYESGDPPILGIAGMRGDTLLVYEMDTPTDAGDDRGDRTLPGTFALLQNHPNPFNPSTTIEFDLPHRSNVLLAVYNILGRKAATLVDRELPAGHHSIRWDARTDRGDLLPSGVYLYRLVADGFTQARNMVLVK